MEYWSGSKVWSIQHCESKFWYHFAQWEWLQLIQCVRSLPGISSWEFWLERSHLADVPTSCSTHWSWMRLFQMSVLLPLFSLCPSILASVCMASYYPLLWALSCIKSADKICNNRFLSVTFIGNPLSNHLPAKKKSMLSSAKAYIFSHFFFILFKKYIRYHFPDFLFHPCQFLSLPFTCHFKQNVKNRGTCSCYDWVLFMSIPNSIDCIIEDTESNWTWKAWSQIFRWRKGSTNTWRQRFITVRQALSG